MLKKDLPLSEVEGLGTSLEESARKLKEFGSTSQDDQIGSVTTKVVDGDFEKIQKVRQSVKRVENRRPFEGKG